MRVTPPADTCFYDPRNSKPLPCPVLLLLIIRCCVESGGSGGTAKRATERKAKAATEKSSIEAIGSQMKYGNDTGSSRQEAKSTSSASKAFVDCAISKRHCGDYIGAIEDCTTVLTINKLNEIDELRPHGCGYH